VSFRLTILSLAVQKQRARDNVVACHTVDEGGTFQSCQGGTCQSQYQSVSDS
jgi:hypothetical protein